MAMRQILVKVPEQVLLAEKMNEADFARELCTLAALKLYERAGFKVTETRTAQVWGAERTEVRMELSLDDS